MKYFHFNPFGTKAVILAFDCNTCGEPVVSEEISIPTPNYLADTASDSQVENEGYAVCGTCEKQFDISIYSTYAGGDGNIDGLDEEDDVEVNEIDDPYDYELDAILSNTKFKETFDEEILKIESLNELVISDDKQRRLLKGNLYVSVITAMEAYLSDAFINTIDKKDEKYLRNFVGSFKSYQEKKIKLSEIFIHHDKIKNEAIKDLKDITFHNLEQAKYLYSKTLNVNYPEELGEYFKIIEKRHDLVHRNGKTKEGDDVIVSPENLSNTILKVSELIGFIDAQIAEI